MLIQVIGVKNFRSILEESLPCDSLAALVGRNGSGKSSFLNALELFYNPAASVVAEDFHSKNVTQDIEIRITFADLSKEATTLFSPYIENGYLTAVRIFSDPESGKSGTYHGMRLQNPDFLEVRNAGGARDVTRKYNEIRQNNVYSSMPSVRSANAVRETLTEWEIQNPTQCLRLRDDGQFFGFSGVGTGYLGRHTKFIYVPAVRDAVEDATERRGSSVTEIMDLVVRSALVNRQELIDFKQDTQDQYKTIMDPKRFAELNNLSQVLSRTLQAYVPDAEVVLRWSELADISIPMPQAHVKLLEDEYESEVERTGHGLQRAFIVTMLQHLVAARGAGAAEESSKEGDASPQSISSLLPNLILAIEEPELYQHPSRQRHLASVLMELATGAIAGVADNTQVIYSTHSPLFVGLDRFDSIRVLQKVPSSSGTPRVTRLKTADLKKVAHELWLAGQSVGEQFTADTLRPRLRSLMTPWMGEGFFADVVLLVEGEEDRAAILGFAKAKGVDFDRIGITLIPCFGKPNLDRPLVIFRQLGIPVYVVWDGDYGANEPRPEANRYLLRLLAQPEEDWPDLVEDSFACFHVKLGVTLENELGKGSFTQWLSEAQNDLGIAKKDQALKNPAIIERVVKVAASNGETSKSLESIIEKITILKAHRET